MLPVPKASRVTLTLDLPRVTQSVADWREAASELVPVRASAPAAAVVVFKNSRRERRDIGHLDRGGQRDGITKVAERLERKCERSLSTIRELRLRILASPASMPPGQNGPALCGGLHAPSLVPAGEAETAQPEDQQGKRQHAKDK